MGLDVLRGLACLSVFAVHSVHSRYSESGWVAMSVFFVLSGYLITLSLLKEEQRGASRSSQLRLFFQKRALRILPALLIFLAVMVPITRSFENGSDAGWGYALLFVHNFYTMSAAHQFTFYFNNLWSLSVEEQFYLFYPWLFIFCDKKRTAVLLSALLLAPLSRHLLSLLATYDPQWFTTMQAAAPGSTPRDVVVYVSSFSHMDAFSLGGLMALHGKPILRWFEKGWRLVLVTAIAMAIGGIITGTQDGFFFRAFMGQAGRGQEVWGYTVINLWACGMVAYFQSITADSMPHRLLAWLGLISYEFYMLHFPVIALFATYLMPFHELSPWSWVLLQFIASLIAAFLLNRAAQFVIRRIRTPRDAPI